MLYIEPLSEKYFHNVQKYIQELQEYIVSCEVWEDDLIVYDTTTEAQESLYAYESSEVIIFIAREEKEVYGFILGRIRKDVSKGSKIQYYGSVGRLYVGKDYRGQGIATKLLDAIENEFALYGASHTSIGVFAPNIGAYNFYKKYGFDERLIVLGKKNPYTITPLPTTISPS